MRPIPLPIAICASGEGTNAQAIIDAIAARRLDAVVRVVVSDRPTAPVLSRAAAAGVPTKVLPGPPSETFVTALSEAAVELICLAGYMRILPPAIVTAFPRRIMNIHPSLLPQFPGLHAVTRALHAGMRVTGVTVHFVDAGIDTGPIILQEAVPIVAGETEASLLAKLHAVEHRLYPEAIQRFAEGKIS